MLAHNAISRFDRGRRTKLQPQRHTHLMINKAASDDPKLPQKRGRTARTTLLLLWLCLARAHEESNCCVLLPYSDRTTSTWRRPTDRPKGNRRIRTATFRRARAQQLPVRPAWVRSRRTHVTQRKRNVVVVRFMERRLPPPTASIERPHNSCRAPAVAGTSPAMFTHAGRRRTRSGLGGRHLSQNRSFL